MNTITPAQALAGLAGRIERLDLATLARLAAHEYDDEAVVPAPGSPGAAFLQDARDTFAAWVRREGRFPQDPDDAAGTWAHGEATPVQQAQAFVDLGLFFSHHAAHAMNASIAGLRQVLDLAAEQLAFTLSEEYGPIV